MDDFKDYNGQNEENSEMSTDSSAPVNEENVEKQDVTSTENTSSISDSAQNTDPSQKKEEVPHASHSQWENNGGQQGYYQQQTYSTYQQTNGYRPPNNQYPPTNQWSSGQQYPGGNQQYHQYQPYQQPTNQQPPKQEYQWNVANYDDKDKQPKPKKNKGLIIFSVILVVALVCTAVSFVLYAMYNGGEGILAGNNTSSAVNSGPNLEINSRPAENAEKTEEGLLTDTAIAKKVKPSVVGIVVYVNSGRQYQMYGQGSGIIMSTDGYIISNAHVFMTEEGTLVNSIQVYLDNEESYGAELVGIDTRSDLAVIKIKANNLTKAEFGDSSTVEVGERVLAIGNPNGMELAGSVTGGIVSAVNRNIKSSSSGFSMTCIQTDAAINPGNSGGALVNAYGQVIGINSSKIVANEYEGIGFAIAINEAKPIVDSLVAHGFVEGRVKVGITYQEIDKFTAALNDVPMGLQVMSIDSTLDVAKSGLQVGDIITKMDGKDIKTTEDVTEFLRTKKPGETVKMTVYRLTALNKSTTLTINVTLAEDRGTSLTSSRSSN
ncbi:MAG: trypsin-like peptidase domain-containing protein [Clostridiales bacterium]|nr:trypsin-like peptidase domain-containing protein [Clostridiales bacterium]